MGRGEQVFTADDMADALGGVINDYGEVIGDPEVLAGEDDVAADSGPRRDPPALAVRTGAFFDEFQPVESTQGARRRIQG